MSTDNTKTTRAKAAKTKTTPADKSAKTESAESKRYVEAISVSVAHEYIGAFSKLNEPGFPAALAKELMHYILQGINVIQTKEVVNEHSYNPYKPEEYILLNSKPQVEKKQAKLKGAAAATLPAMVPKKKGQQHAPQPEPVSNTDEDDQPSNTADVIPASEIKVEETKTKTKGPKSITQINKNAKTYLAFIVNRFVFEIFSMNKAPNMSSDTDFTNYVLSGLSGDIFKSQLCRVIVPTVNRLQHEAQSIKEQDLATRLTSAIKNSDTGFDNDLITYIVRYLVSYFRLLGWTLANQLWLVHKGVSAQSIETAMRMLDFGNHDYLYEAAVCTDDEPDLGLHYGVLSDAREHDKLINPPPTDAEKAARAATRGKKKAPAVNTETEAEAEPTEADAEADAEAEPEPETQIEYDDENGGAEVEAEPEPEPEPVKPAVVKPVRKLAPVKSK